MYSRNTARKGESQGEMQAVSVPPHYDGVRFKRSSRSDGRSSDFEESLRGSRENTLLEKEKMPSERTAPTPFEECCEGIAEKKTERKVRYSATELLSELKEDDILIIALIVILAGERGAENRDILFLLVLLLCLR